MPDTETAVVTTVGCSVLGLVLAGPVGAVLGGGLAVAALQSELRSFSKGRLHIAQVSLPQDGVVRHSGVTYFTMHLVDEQGRRWQVLRRYTDFDEFHKAVHNRDIHAYFPGKTWLPCHGPQLEERRRYLEAWVRDVFRCFTRIGIPSSLELEFEDFLHRGMGQVTGPMAAPAASAPASVGTAATAAAGFLIQVPPGVVPGQTLTVKSPDGTSFQITVPEGCAAGSTLQVSTPSPANPSSAATACPVSAPQVGGSSSGGKIFLSISVPPNISAGQKIAVKVPDGRELTLMVPANLQHREDLQLEFDVAAGQLKPVALPEASEATSSEEVFQIQVPCGVHSGQMVNIQVPDGRQLPLIIPPGKQPGDDLLLCLDATRSRLLLAKS
ncbi:unnamed protein product [Durusdinium trenchii]|uniref:PX domain-containing protein n=1 Tax=Durusdinium trenchii TaxID=1381693 RepID=A0ABP0PUB3_9DINO